MPTRIPLPDDGEHPRQEGLQHPERPAARRARWSIRRVMYADTAVNLALMAAILLGASSLAEALRLSSVLPVMGLAALVAVSASSHWVTGRTGSRRAVKIMIVMDGSALLLMTLLAALDPLRVPAWVRGLFVLMGLLALTMGALKVLALRAPAEPAGEPPA